MKKQETATNNYSNIVFTHFLDNEAVCYEKGHLHFIIYVLSGELAIKESEKKEIIISSGQCVFVRRDHRLIFFKRPSKDKQYKGITMAFDRNFLRHYYQNLDSKSIPSDAVAIKSSIRRLSGIPSIESVFTSLFPYFNTGVEPVEDVMKLKREEAVLALLNTDKNFYPTLFDFTEPWKIDILSFLNENYMDNLSMEEIASYTGRSLATFKRDFKKVSNLTPQKWIIEKRLETAYLRLTEDKKKISDVYLDVGFKNRSHFVTAFKKKYGFPPVNLTM